MDIRQKLRITKIQSAKHKKKYEEGKLKYGYFIPSYTGEQNTYGRISETKFGAETE